MFLTDDFTAGLVLSVRKSSPFAGARRASRNRIAAEKGELWVYNMYVTEYPNAGYMPQDPRRKHKLLLQRTELKKLKKVKDVGVTLVPTLLFIASSGYVTEVLCGQRQEAATNGSRSRTRHLTRPCAHDGPNRLELWGGSGLLFRGQTATLVHEFSHRVLHHGTGSFQNGVGHVHRE